LLTIGEALAQQPTIAETRLTNSIQRGSETNTAPQLEMPHALFLPNASQLTPLDEAYLDAFSILKEDNTCSAFYGGPPAIEVLNQLKRQLKVTHLNGTVTVRMTGKEMNLTSLPYSLSYRLFDKAELNVNGPFYRGNDFNSQLSMPNIGGFLPNTRQARVTILLHELGHLIKRADKQWLLPNDGGNDYLSQENTTRVIALCGEQIRHLSRVSFARELQAARTASPGPATNANVLKP
jgi:hypothetical protein